MTASSSHPRTPDLPANSIGASDAPTHRQLPEAAVLKRGARETRALALALRDAPPPEFTKVDLQRRWKIGADTVRKVLRESGVDPGREKGGLVPMFDVLRCEGVADPLLCWASAMDRMRELLSADLLTPDERGLRAKDAVPDRGALSPRGRTAEPAPCILIGRSRRFRPSRTGATACREDPSGSKP